MPGEQQTAFLTSVIFETVVGHELPVQEKYVPEPGGGVVIAGGLKPGVGVTTAILAPCLTAFLREFFVYQALANSVIPKTTRSSKKRVKAVSTSV